MAQSTTVNVRVDKTTKRDIEVLFDSLGMNISTAVNMFFKQALMEEALPFQPRKKRKSLDQYLEEYHGKPLEMVLREAEEQNEMEPPAEIDWGKPVGDEIW